MKGKESWPSGPERKRDVKIATDCHLGRSRGSAELLTREASGQARQGLDPEIPGPCPIPEVPGGGLGPVSQCRSGFEAREARVRGAGRGQSQQTTRQDEEGAHLSKNGGHDRALAMAMAPEARDRGQHRGGRAADRGAFNAPEKKVDPSKSDEACPWRRQIRHSKAELDTALAQGNHKKVD